MKDTYHNMYQTNTFQFVEISPGPISYSFSLSGLTPVMAAVIDYVMKPFRRLHITTTEYATLQTIMFFDPGMYTHPYIP